MAVSNLGFTDGVGLSIKVGATEYNGHIKDARFENEDEDASFKTFASAATGDGRWMFRGTAFQSFKTASFWRYAWDNAGSTATITLAPYGNATPTADEPHFTATATIGRKPNLGGEVDEEFEFEVEWELTDPPVMDDGTP